MSIIAGPASLTYPTTIAQRAERRAGLAHVLDQLEQLTGAVAKPIQLGHHDHVAGLERGHELGQLRSVSPDAAHLLRIDRGRAGLLKRFDLPA